MPPRRGMGILIPGMACPGSVFCAPLLPHLAELGLAYTTLNLPSIDPKRDQPIPHGAGNGLAADATAIRAALLELIEHPTNSEAVVVPVAHSYGGAPTILAANGLWRAQRSRHGLKGGIDAIALIASALPLPGDSVASARASFIEETGGMPDPVPELEMSAAVRLHPRHVQGFYPSRLVMILLIRSTRTWIGSSHSVHGLGALVLQRLASRIHHPLVCPTASSLSLRPHHAPRVFRTGGRLSP